MSLRKTKIATPEEVQRLAFEASLRGMRGERDEARRRVTVMQGELQALQKRFDQLASVRAPFVSAPFVRDVRGGAQDQGVSLVTWSDWHVAEKVDKRLVDGRNAYSPEIAEKRAAACVASTIRIHRHLAKSYAVPEMVLYLGGDFITGYLHPELEQTNAMGPVEEAHFAQRLLASALDELAGEKTIKRLRVVCMRGNHGRTTKKMQFKNDYETSLESFIYWTLADRFKASSKIVVEVPRADVHEFEIVKDWLLRVFHGHQVKYNDGIGGLTIPLNKWESKMDRTLQADFNLMCHYHTYMLPNPRTILNGSLKGWDEYARSHGFPFQEPLQAFALLDVKRRMVAQHLPIFCA
jgi:hypothetical protein